MKLIVGLGNIGTEYHETRHNIGFMAVDALAQEKGVTFQPTKQQATVASFRHENGTKVLLAKPTTYMNNSGEAVRALMTYYKLTPADVLVLVDDMDLPFGKLRFRPKGSAGGHNGLKSIMACLDTRDFLRLKFGIGHPEHAQQAVGNFVLGKFTPTERPVIDTMVARSCAAMIDWVAGRTVNALSNTYNAL